MKIKKIRYILLVSCLFVFSNTITANNFYWVGNSGNWNDAAHWSATSGGDGGIGTPTLNDDVFFDANSFNIANALVTISNNITLHNLTLKENSVPFTLLSHSSTQIKIYGNLTVNGSFTNALKSDIYFKSTKNSTHEMYFGWFNWKSNFFFDGAGTYLFKSPLQAHNNNLQIISGTVNLNGFDVLCGSFISNSTKKRKLISSKSTILAYQKWHTTQAKFNYDFSQTVIYVLSSTNTAINKDGDDYTILQNKTPRATAKTINTITLLDDTVSCGNASDGVLTVSFTTNCANGFVDWLPGPGVDIYTGECFACPISGPNPSNTITNLPPGTYTAVLTNDCDADIQALSAVVSGHPPIVPLLQNATPTSCNGICDGATLVIVTGAPYADFSYLWLTGNPIDTNNNLSNICAGSYDLEVRDGFGCIDTFSLTVAQPDSVRTNVSVTNPLCFGDCSGSATSTPSGGTPGYSYLWNTSPLDTFATLNNLCSGTAYTLTVTDSKGCVNDTTITPVEPPQIVIDTSRTYISCGGICDASITTTVTGGGTSPFVHFWSTGKIEAGNSSSITNLCAGTYTDSIVDANGCDSLISFTISEPPILTATTSTTDVSCFSFCDGTATTVPAGGTPPYVSFLWDSIPTGAPFPIAGNPISNLCPGDYFVTITDNNSCTVLDTINIVEPLLLIVNPSATDITCNGFCDGTATATPTGGTAPLSYLWTGPGGPYNTQTINSLCLGKYILTITDFNNCVSIDSIIIAQPSPLNLVMSSTNESCAGVCDGTAGVVVTGGTPAYSYIWVPDPGIPNGQGTSAVTNLCPGTYTVNITDGAGCSEKDSVIISPKAPIIINITSTNLSCNNVCNGTATISPVGGTAPYDVQWNGGGYATNDFTIAGLCAGNDTVNVRDANGCIATLSFIITEPSLLTTVSSGTDLLCAAICNGSATTTPSGGTAPYAVTWSGPGGPYAGTTLSNLCAGTYVATITDDSLCVILDTVIITEPLVLDPNAQFTHGSCNGIDDGTAIAVPIGGTPIYSYGWTGPGGPYTTQAIGPLAAGQYIVTVTDMNGCSKQETIDILNPPLITANASASTASCGSICDGIATGVPTGGTPGFTYLWDAGTGNQTTAAATNLCAGIYTVTITDTNGCSAQDTTEIKNLVTVKITPSLINISCNGVCDGAATAVASGGQIPYTYLWSNGDITPTTNGLCPIKVYVTVTDANGCSASDSITMPIGPMVLVPNGSIDQIVSCYNACDAKVSSAPTGGTAPYTSVWTLPNGIDTNNVCSPFAVITVTDANSCVQSDTLVIINPDSIAPNPTITNLSCNGVANGSISLAPTGGTPGYAYSWLPGGQNTASITNQPAGVYTVTIIDAAGCFRIDVYTITEPALLTSSPITQNISCFGVCDGIATVTVGGGTAPYTYNWPPGGETTDTIFNLCAGNYSVLVIDMNGCPTSQNFTIVEPPLLDVNVSGTNLSCAGGGACDGSAISNPIGGNAPYTYAWSANATPNVLTNQSITNLCPAIYTVTVTDNNNCSINDTYEVTTPPMIAVTLDSTNVTCNGFSNGTTTATPTGGSAPYTYSWTGPCVSAPANTPTITNLCAGVYTVTVTDNVGCFFTGSITVTEPTAIDDNESVSMANCGVADGNINMFPNGGTPGYTHSWSNGITTPNNNSLTAGFYTDTITDNNGCIAIFTIAVSNPAGPSGITPTTNDVTCYGACDGSINTIVHGGTTPYTYAWSSIPMGGPYATDSTINSLCAGDYNLTVTDANNCILARTIVINNPDSIHVVSMFTTTTCNGTCDGTASISTSGGTAPYTYAWSNGETTSSVSGLCAGAISVVVTDDNGCTKTINFNITSPSLLTLGSSKTIISCNAACDATATAIPAGGTAPYTYLWNDALAQTTATANNLCAGIYDVVVTDANGCSTNTTVTLTEPSIIIANETTTPATCGSSNGTAMVTPTGGTAPYTYLWCNGVTTATVNALPAGACNVDITDANGCTQSFLITISNPTGPKVTTASNNASCNGICDGSANATVTSGTPNYTFLWSPGGETTSAITGLCAGNYAVQVTDGIGCVTTNPISINDNTIITATSTLTNATCNGNCDGSAIVFASGGIPPYQYNWNGGVATGQTTSAVTGLCAGTYTVTITDLLGCSFIKNIDILEPNVLTVSPTGIAASCNGSCNGSATSNPTGGSAPYSYLWSTGATTSSVTALCAGNYTVTVTDINGCTTNGMVAISENTVLNAAINTNNASCGLCDANATIVPNGGAGSPYTYLWLASGQTTASVSNLCAGGYQVEVSDNLGCAKLFNVHINNLAGPTTTISSDSVICFSNCDGNAYVTITSGTPPYLFQWNDPSLQVNDTASNLCAGVYNVIVKDGLGCITVDSITVASPPEFLANISTTNPNCATVCDGTATVSPSGGVGVITILWSASAGNQTTATASNLCAGTHTVTLTDAKGCIKIDSITLVDPTPTVITLGATIPSCNNDCDGLAFSTVTGGTPGYMYSWNTTPVQVGPIANNLCTGLYTLTITDNNNCISSEDINVINPTLLNTTSVMTPVNCNGSCDGSITTTPAGGIPPYTYVWSNGSSAATANNLCAGTYNVAIIDFNNCTFYDTVTVTEPALLNNNTVIAEPACGLCDGSATAAPIGGVGPYTFVWTNPITNVILLTTVSQASSTVVGLCAETLTLEITDLGSGCVSNHTVLVNNSTGPTVVVSATNETCVSACDGTALASATLGTTPYTYSWSSIPVQTDSNAINLCAGFYTVTVTDAAGCIIMDTVSITTNGLTLSISNIIHETCFGDCDGSATVSSGTGVAPFSYLWNPTAGTNATATNLCVGTYVATVTDNNSCSDSISTIITGPSTLNVTASENIAINCNGICNGAAIATGLGGTPNYTYLWNDPLNQTTQIATGLCAGTYIVILTDNNGCSATDTITLNEPSAIVANETITNPNCNLCDGSIALVPTGGFGPYTFSWTTPSSPPNPTTSLVNSLCAGAYTAEITDNNGCSESFNIPLSSINAPLPNTSVVNNVSCFGSCDGEITSAPTGGTAPYTYNWTPTGGTNNTASALCEGTYTLIVTDFIGCVGVAIENITQPDIIQTNVSSANINCNGTCDGWATSNPIGGTAPYTFNWMPGNLVQDSITNLCSGIYTVTVTDKNNCTAQGNVMIIEPAALSVSTMATPTSCSGVCDGSGILTVSGGVGPYLFEWNGNTTPGQTNTGMNLCFGNNTAVITDQQGCSIIENIAIGALDTVLADAGNDVTICIGDNTTLIGTPGGNFTTTEWFDLLTMTSLGTSNSIIVSPSLVGSTCYVYQVTGNCVVSDTVCVITEALPPANAGTNTSIIEGFGTTLIGTGGGTYSWSPGATLSDSTNATPEARPKESTEYYLTVTSPLGCVNMDTVLVTVIPTINFPNGITPNGDGKNDVWIIDFIEDYPNNVVEIYNRWGELLFHAEGYLQNWDGTYNGKELPIGTYYYIIDLGEKGIKNHTGPITILR